jgi:GTP-binding protein
VLILDIRRTPVAEYRQMLDWLRAYGITPVLVVTKCDKVSRNERARQAAVIAQSLGVERGELTFFSTLTREGKDEIWQRIETLLFPGADGGAEEEGQPLSV